MSFVSLSHGHDDIVFDSFISIFYQYLHPNNNKRLGFPYINSTNDETSLLTQLIQFPQTSMRSIEKVFTYDVTDITQSSEFPKSVREILMQVPNSIFGSFYSFNST